jgi:spermidine/putrescine transport system substrate-binding protein
MKHIDRRTVLKTSGATLAAATAGCIGGGDGGDAEIQSPMDVTEEDFENPRGVEDTFNNWNWFDGFAEYSQEQLPQDFEGLETVNVSGYAAPSEWFSQLQSGNYDIDNIGGTANFTARSVENDLLAPIPLDRMPNVQEYVPDQYLDVVDDFFTDEDGNRYALPQSRGVNPALAYNTNEFDEAPSSWDVLWNEEYADRMIIQDRPRTAVQIGARYTGQDWTDPDDFEEIKEALIQQKDLVSTYWAEYSSGMQQYVNESALVGTMTMGRLYDARFNNDGNVDWTVPEEGTTFFSDTFIIPADAPHPAISTYYTNWAAHPENAFKLFETMGYLPAVDVDLEEQGVSQERAEFVDWQARGGDRLDFSGPLDDDVREQYSELWTEVKAA